MMPPPSPPAIVSQAPADRVSRIAQRISSALDAKRVTDVQAQLFQIELDAAKRAIAKNDPKAPAMLTTIEQQLSPLDLTLTAANAGQAIVAYVGDDVTVAMQDQYFWDVAVSDTAALSLHRGVMFIRGVQGIYTAAKPATVTLHAVRRDNGQSVDFTVVILPKR